MQTQSWRAENEPATGEPQYSYAALRHLVELLEAHDRAWERFLAGKEHVLTLTYEEVASDIGDAVARTLAHIGVAPDAAAGALPTMRRQADERSDEWAEAYAKDTLATTR